MARCQICSKSKTAGNAVSHSQIHTKRQFKPNLQKVSGLVICTRCLKSVKKIASSAEAQPVSAEK